MEDSTPNGILVVDDEDDFRRLVCDHLRDRSYEPIEAVDGLQALEVYNQRRDKIALVITDFRMPRMNGEALIRELRRVHDYLPIIGTTTYRNEAEQILSVGGFYFLEKPIDHWLSFDAIVQTAVRRFQDEKTLREERAKAREISRLLRSYVLNNPVEAFGTTVRFFGGIQLDISVHSVDTERPGGDLVEWFRPTPSEFVFYVADAMGHDLVACFIACLNSMVFHRSHHGRRPPIEQLVADVHRAVNHLCTVGGLDPNRHYLSLFVGYVNLEHRELIYVNAGHPDALLIRPGHEPRRLRSTFGLIGTTYLKHPPVAKREYLWPGDLLFLYTDGATDVLEGIAELERIVEPLAPEAAVDVVQRVEAALLERLARSGMPGFGDDTTLMAIKVLGADPS